VRDSASALAVVADIAAAAAAAAAVAVAETLGFAVEVVLVHNRRASVVQLHTVGAGMVGVAPGAESAVAEDSWKVYCSETYGFADAEPPLLPFSFRSCSCSTYGRSSRQPRSPGRRRS
jgi:hypothetical protein